MLKSLLYAGVSIAGFATASGAAVAETVSVPGMVHNEVTVEPDPANSTPQGKVPFQATASFGSASVIAANFGFPGLDDTDMAVILFRYGNAVDIGAGVVTGDIEGAGAAGRLGPLGFAELATRRYGAFGDLTVVGLYNGWATFNLRDDSYILADDPNDLGFTAGSLAVANRSIVDMSGDGTLQSEYVITLVPSVGRNEVTVALDPANSTPQGKVPFLATASFGSASLAAGNFGVPGLDDVDTAVLAIRYGNVVDFGAGVVTGDIEGAGAAGRLGPLGFAELATRRYGAFGDLTVVGLYNGWATFNLRDDSYILADDPNDLGFTVGSLVVANRSIVDMSGDGTLTGSKNAHLAPDSANLEVSDQQVYDLVNDSPDPSDFQEADERAQVGILFGRATYDINVLTSSDADGIVAVGNSAEIYARADFFPLRAVNDPVGSVTPYASARVLGYFVDPVLLENTVQSIDPMSLTVGPTALAGAEVSYTIRSVSPNADDPFQSVDFIAAAGTNAADLTASNDEHYSVDVDQVNGNNAYLDSREHRRFGSSTLGLSNKTHNAGAEVGFVDVGASTGGLNANLLQLGVEDSFVDAEAGDANAYAGADVSALAVLADPTDLDSVNAAVGVGNYYVDQDSAQDTSDFQEADERAQVGILFGRATYDINVLTSSDARGYVAVGNLADADAQADFFPLQALNDPVGSVTPYAGVGVLGYFVDPIVVENTVQSIDPMSLTVGPTAPAGSELSYTIQSVSPNEDDPFQSADFIAAAGTNAVDVTASNDEQYSVDVIHASGSRAYLDSRENRRFGSSLLGVTNKTHNAGVAAGSVDLDTRSGSPEANVLSRDIGVEGSSASVEAGNADVYIFGDTMVPLDMDAGEFELAADLGANTLLVLESDGSPTGATLTIMPNGINQTIGAGLLDVLPNPTDLIGLPPQIEDLFDNLPPVPNLP